MLNKLSLNALTLMIGQQVRVLDLAYDAPMQICEVKAETNLVKQGRKNVEVITKLWLENEEFKFEYELGKCKNGEFEVFTLK